METVIYTSPNLPITSDHVFTIESSQAGQRIDKFLCQALPAYSRSYFQTLIENGHITINKAPAKSSALLKIGDIVAITIPVQEKRPLFNPVNTNLGIEILYTHEHFFIIYKPAGLLVHQTEVPTTEPTVVDWLLSNHAELSTIGSSERPGIIHRLDKDTSGLLVLARTNYAHKTFAELFKKRTISKTYMALVQGHPPASGTINLAIGRDPANRKKMTTFIPDDNVLSLTTVHRVRRQVTTRNAVTHYTVKEYFNDCALVQVQPITGRTHQIRVHFAAIGHPLIGDYVYGTPSKLINRHALHAASLSFTFLEAPFNFVKEIPEDFKRLIQIVQNS